jgi:hypothetical protein
MTHGLGTQLIIATAMVALTVVTHLLGLSVLIAATHRHSGNLQNDRAFALQMLVLVGVSFGLFILHGVEIWTYATLYYTVGAIHDPRWRLCFLGQRQMQLHKVRDRTRSHLLHYIGAMNFDRALAQTQINGNYLIGRSLDHQIHNLPLAGC